MAASTGLALSHRTTPLNCAAPFPADGPPRRPPPIPPMPGMLRPPRPPPLWPDCCVDTVISFAQGDFVIIRSTSSADHSDGSFLFQNSESAAYTRRVTAQSRI